MKKLLLLVPMMIGVMVVSAQKQKNTPAPAAKVDSICFHLYTDSLKKGTHNYINVDGKMADGRWMPLTSKEIQFTASAGKFEGNDLVLPINFTPASVTIKAVLKND